MTRREKFFAAINRKMDGYIPFEFNLCPALEKKFFEKTGQTNYAEYYDMPLRFISVWTKVRDVNFEKYHSKINEISIDNTWGIGHKSGSVEHFSEMKHPMEKFDTIEEFASYPYPDPINDFDWDSFNQNCNNLKSRDLIAVGAMAVTIFEICWYMRGMDNFMLDMIVNPELANYHLDRVTEIRCVMAKKYAECGVDILHLGDDVSTQLDMMISPTMWREFIKPRLKKVIDSAKSVNPDIIIDYHGDGNLQKIIPELIEIGVQILNPVQPECMDPVKIKEQYGDKLSFRGTIGTQTTLPFGSAEEVERICIEMITKVGKGGGLILAPTHMVEPEVPWENVEIMINTIKKFNENSK